jgi:hypothetical protein
MVKMSISISDLIISVYRVGWDVNSISFANGSELRWREGSVAPWLRAAHAWQPAAGSWAISDLDLRANACGMQREGRGEQGSGERGYEREHWRKRHLASDVELRG